MTHRLYCLRDRIANSYFSPFEEVNDAMAVRRIYPMVRQGPNAKDMELWKIGEFDSETGRIMEATPICISWTAYEFGTENKANKIDKEDFGKENK